MKSYLAFMMSALRTAKTDAYDEGIIDFNQWDNRFQITNELFRELEPTIIDSYDNAQYLSMIGEVNLMGEKFKVVTLYNVEV